jgi:hypothetical protein
MKLKITLYLTVLLIAGMTFAQDFKGHTSAPTTSQWCVKMKCSTDGFGQCTMVEVEASSQDEAYKKAKEKFPECTKVDAWEKRNGQCTCN